MSIRFIPLAVFLLVIGIPAAGIGNHIPSSNIPPANDITNSDSNTTTNTSATITSNTIAHKENTGSVGNQADNRTATPRNDLVNNNVTTTTTTTSATSPSSFITNEVMINEVELNPPGDDAGHQWIELYNPSYKSVSISNYKIMTSFESAEIGMPINATINAVETYLIKLDAKQTLSHAEILTLVDSTGKIVDRTPMLVDRNDDDYTWQRVPDGFNEWKFAPGTPGELNDPSAAKNNPIFSTYDNSTVHCLGSAGCAEGVVIRVVDAGTLYVRVNGIIYKVNLALIQIPTKSEQGSIDATSFTRNLCLGSSVLVDQDDKLLASNGSVIAVVYCSDTNLNSDLLNNGFAIINKDQCGTSEFADQPWAKAHGC